MSIINLSVPRHRITSAMGQIHAPHLRSLLTAVRDYGIGLCVVPQGKEPFDPPTNRPHVTIVGDDMFEAKGPAAFHRRSIIRFARRCKGAVIVACSPIERPYACAAASAVGLGHDVILIETRPTFEADWKTFLEAANRDLAFIIATVKPEGGTH
jgi:hypothetical protein